MIFNSTKVYENARTAVTKATLIDAPTHYFLGSNILYAPYKTAIAAGTYFTRSTIKDLTKDKLSHTLDIGDIGAGILAGGVGGYFKYLATGQHPIVGAVNNALYETCNNFDFCAKNPYVSIPFAIAVETLDAAAQVGLAIYFGTAQNDATMMGAAASGFKLGAFISLMSQTTDSLYKEAASEHFDDAWSFADSLLNHTPTSDEL